MPEQNQNLIEATHNSGKSLYERMKNNPPTENILGQIEADVSHVCGGLWFVMRNKHNNVLGYGAQELETVKQWCEQNLHPELKPDVDYDIIIVGIDSRKSA